MWVFAPESEQISSCYPVETIFGTTMSADTNGVAGLIFMMLLNLGLGTFPHCALASQPQDMLQFVQKRFVTINNTCVMQS